MRVTEALAWYNNTSGSARAMSHFKPTGGDIDARKKYQKVRKRKRKRHKDIFE